MREYKFYTETTDEQINTVWLLLSATMVLFMQAGTAIAFAGGAHKKNRNSIIVMKWQEIIIGCLAWWLFGFGIAFGKPTGFLGLDSRYYASSGFYSL